MLAILVEKLLKNWIECMEIMGLTNDPLLKSLVTQRMAEQIGGEPMSPGQTDRAVLVTVRANELGISAKEIGNGSALGIFVRNQGFDSLGKVPMGKFSVHTYKLTPDLDRTILQFFGQSTAIAA